MTLSLYITLSLIATVIWIAIVLLSKTKKKEHTLEPPPVVGGTLFVPIVKAQREVPQITPSIINKKLIEPDYTFSEYRHLAPALKQKPTMPSSGSTQPVQAVDPSFDNELREELKEELTPPVTLYPYQTSEDSCLIPYLKSLRDDIADDELSQLEVLNAAFSDVTNFAEEFKQFGLIANRMANDVGIELFDAFKHVLESHSILGDEQLPYLGLFIETNPSQTKYMQASVQTYEG